MEILISGEYNAFKEGYNSAGVYMWSGVIPSHTFKNPIYIGSSVDLFARHIRGHIPDLENNIHYNSPLQNYFNKNGGMSNMVLYLIENCDAEYETCKNREQYYLDLYEPFVDIFNGFNISRKANSFDDPKLHERKTKEFIIKSPTGEIVKGRNITKFCRDNNLTPCMINNVLNGKSYIHRGWTAIDGVFKKDIPRTIREFDVISPNGEVIHGDNYLEFCENKNLNKGNFRKMLFGETGSSRGWTLANSDFNYKKRGKHLSLISPNGERISFIGLEKFARKNGLTTRLLQKVINGEVPHHKGWRKDSPENLCKFKSEVFVDYSFISPDGKIYQGSNISQFTKEHNLSISQFTALQRDEISSSGGWRKYKEGVDYSISPRGKEFVLKSPEGIIYKNRNLRDFCNKMNLDRKLLSEVANGKREEFHGWTKAN